MEKASNLAVMPFFRGLVRPWRRVAGERAGCAGNVRSAQATAIDCSNTMLRLNGRARAGFGLEERRRRYADAVLGLLNPRASVGEAVKSIKAASGKRAWRAIAPLGLVQGRARHGSGRRTSSIRQAPPCKATIAPDTDRRCRNRASDDR
jgi:hypothetical protein